MSCQLRLESIYWGVAQLGERTVRIRKVKGSNPSVSTMKEVPANGRDFFHIERNGDSNPRALRNVPGKKRHAAAGGR